MLAPIFCSVDIAYLHFLHSDANVTNVLLPISCDLQGMDQQVEYSLIQTFRLLKQIIFSFGRLFHEKIMKSLGISNYSLISNNFLCPVINREYTVDLFWRIDSLFNS